jgi:hypothetical protein
MLGAALAALVSGCKTAEMGTENRPWWETTINPAAVPWPLPTGDLAPVDYHNAHGAGWWDVPWVFAEQIALLPSYAVYAIAETTYTEILNGGYSYDRHQWQWRAVNWTIGPPYIILSSVNYGAVWVADTIGHDPIAAIIWWFKKRNAEARSNAEELSPETPRSITPQ